MGRGSGIQFRLVLTLVAIGLAAVAGLLAILPYRLYERDIRLAADQAHRVSGVVQAALTCPLAAGSDAAGLVERIQAAGDMRVALSRLEAGALPAGAVAGRGSSVLDDTALRYVGAPVMDAQGRPWIAELQFDLSPMKRESLRLVFDLVVAIVLGATLFGAVVFWFVRRAFVLPLRELTRAVLRRAAGDPDPRLPRFESLELQELAQAVARLPSPQERAAP